jgi:ribonuclease BN (tRNA processing enzyme)
MGIPVFEPYKTDKDKAFGNMIPCFKLTAFRLPHDGESNFGTLIYTKSGHRMVYLTDFEYCPYVFAKQKLNTILIECNYTKVDENADESKKNHVYRGHCSLETCKAFLKANQTDALRNVILCHLSSDNADPVEMVSQVQEVVGSSVKVIVARKGVSITL